ncbi:polysaccharide biosynthesis/export family protein [Breoghania sp. L-A4]|uniref:polysaccharide biosynthesis/export family protein n=1 Tax=Breoghania sp. L-A4 TaxID=2304600 RepID=UPI000E35EEAD|nr:polysaccharide biosynthesis/export family protein [Breoghania sp. L-A4]AXS40968.1 polysaccharide export protein [Breoghania sp. L-A4]
MRTTIVASILLSLLMAGCSGYRRPPTAFHEVLTQPYHLDSGDRLRIVVYGQDNITNSYTVDQAGFISVPLIGEVAARGSTTKQLQTTLETQLSQGFLRDPDVSVEVEQYRPFFVMGEVRNAGQYPYVAGMTAQTAIAIAGGFNARAKQGNVDITRQINGEILNARVPLSDPLRPGDTIYVRERLF